MSRPARRDSAPTECPVCGTDLPPNARACPHCGADERTGWNEDESRYDGLDLPDAAFEDDDTPRSPRRPLRHGPHPAWIVVGLVLVVLFIFAAVSPLFSWF